MQDRPTPDELLGALEAFVRGEVLPEADGRRRYHLLVALNLLAVLRRELALEPRHLRREWDGLRTLGRVSHEPADYPSAVRHANETLCAAIRAGDYDHGAGREALLRHLRAVVADKLRIANPAFLERVGGT